jgi:hypothetical protein
MQMDQDTQPVELRLDVPSAGRAVINDWMKGLTLVSAYYPDPQTVITVAKDEEGKYHVSTFFSVGANWVASVDAQGVSADKAFFELARRIN